VSICFNVIGLSLLLSRWAGAALLHSSPSGYWSYRQAAEKPDVGTRSPRFPLERSGTKNGRCSARKAVFSGNNRADLPITGGGGDPMSDFSVIVISLAVIVLCWAVVRINQKVDEMTDKPNSFNDFDSMEPKPLQGELPRR
jgi:hypothetical protein